MDHASLIVSSESLIVPSVQEIVKEPLTRVPERYVRPHHDRPIISTTTPLLELPVIDFSKLFSQDLTIKGLELDKLHSACKEWGFFQLINHGVSTSLVENVKMGAKEFYNLPIEEKKKFSQKEGDVEGYGQAFVMSEEQKLDWADMFFMITLPSHMRKPHLFPKLPLPFRDDLETYSAELKKLAIQIIDFMANALKVDAKEIRELFGEGTQSTRINYYPPCPQPELVIGLNSHSDGGGLTILLQGNEMDGLQIKKDGFWIPVKPLPNAFIINLGDMLEIITNGIYPSIEHRATVNLKKERLSIATFYSPSSAVILRPSPTLVTPKTPALFKPIGVTDFYKGYLGKELRGKSFLDSLRIQNEDEKHT
ncbi:putative thebaine 6-O-demethylase [Medicago truncatula]|uniref:Putative thebaine 6-O-demethylase n=1 Tax=Medicago truncatula TaxID=3880 RepID=A0A396GMH7_MEDTR|nr:probable 2-oxoglutarate/Fe(II)-dependent dioxygenase [Medicago truncatula]RHN42326.1 putative thebaine 6-O-demethylase [Medicago truncatula]